MSTVLTKLHKMEKEDGEMSDDNMAVDEELPPHSPVRIDSDAPLTLLFKAEDNGLVIKALEKVDAEKIEERARRFGLNLTGNRIITQKQIDELYANFGITKDNERHFRFDTLHLNGVGGLSTRDIFEYLEDYKPVSLEWVDETTCNMVFQDHITAALTLLVHSREVRNEELVNMLSKSSTYHWREGMPHEKNDLILMRFATKSDKKDAKKQKEMKKASISTIDQSMDSVSKNPWGDLCQSWGMYDHQEILNDHSLPRRVHDEYDEPPKRVLHFKNKNLAKRLGKRNVQSECSVDSDSDSEWKSKSKKIRMRMRADDINTPSRMRELSPLHSNNEPESDAFAPLSIEVINNNAAYEPKQMTKLSEKFRHFTKGNRQNTSIRSRLGAKVNCTDDRSSDHSSDEVDHQIMSKVNKVNINNKKSSIWSRLEVPQKQSTNDDLRQMLKSKQTTTTTTKVNDLRDRLKKSKDGVSLRIEINNDIHSD